MNSRGNQVRAVKRQKAANIRTNPYNRSTWPSPYNVGKRRACAPANNSAKPDANPEKLTRQQVRQMLRTKAKHDLTKRFGRVGGNSQLLTFVGMSRKARRGIILTIAAKWWKTVATASREDPAFGHKRGFIKDIMRTLLGNEGNTLAASGA